MCGATPESGHVECDPERARWTCHDCGEGAENCRCDDEEECPDCHHTYCICDSDDRDRDWWYATRREVAEWRRAHAGCGNLDAIGRKLTRHGTPLGGYPWQKRANRRRGMQARRKWDRRYPSECPEHKGGACPDDCANVPF